MAFSYYFSGAQVRSAISALRDKTTVGQQGGCCPNQQHGIKQTVTSYKKKPMCELQDLVTRRFVLEFLGNWEACTDVRAEFGIVL